MLHSGDGRIVIEGSAFSSQDEFSVTYREKSLYVVAPSGMIEHVIPVSSDNYSSIREEASRLGCLTSLQKGQYLLPGFVDLHVHSPQWAQDGAALDEPLERWLGKYTFPTESRFTDNRYATKVHSHLVDTLLSRGTTTVLYFDTIYRNSATGLARICAEKGQRAFVGKVVMDDPEANPEYYRETTDEAIAETERFITEIYDLNTPQGVYPLITPRFIPSCTDKGLEALGCLASQYQCFTQTHCSEGDWEHATVWERFGKSDAEALSNFGLLTDKTVMHHCVYLSESDADIFARNGAAVAHCPYSNAYFASAVCPVRRYRGQGVTVGMGTDISGGYAPSMYEVIRMAAIASRMLEYGVDMKIAANRRGVPGSLMTLDQAFWLATVGGASALHVNTGRLDAGYIWDAQIVDVHAANADLPIFDEEEEPKVVFQKIMNLSGPTNIKKVWCQGRVVYEG